MAIANLILQSKGFFLLLVSIAGVILLYGMLLSKPQPVTHTSNHHGH